MESNNTLTHPMLYRQQVNSPDQKNSTRMYQNKRFATTKAMEQQQEWHPRPIKDGTSTEEPCWDCYPSMVRKIENEGTPEQVEQLHELESRSP